MKTIIRNSRVIAIGLAAVFATAFTPAPPDQGKDLPVELKYIGGSLNRSLVQLDITGSSIQNDFMIIISDQFSNVIYKENVRGEKITKKFSFDNEEIGDDTLRFEVFCRKTNKSVIYTLNRQSRFTEDITIAELK
jgi:hypothetical protein